MIIRQANGGAIFHHLAELSAELQPRGVMLGVVVDLVAGKEEDISVDSLNILDNILTRDIASVARLNGVSRESRDDNFIFVDWIFADDSLVRCLRAMEDTVLSQSSTRNGAVHPGWITLVFATSAHFPSFSTSSLTV